MPLDDRAPDEKPKIMKTLQAFRGIWRDTLPNRIETSGPNASHGSVNLDRLAFRTRRPFPSPGPTPRRWRPAVRAGPRDRKSTRLNSSHLGISYAVFCLKKKKK